MSHRILIVHPEGNINYNAGLLGLAEILSGAGHRVAYLGRKRDEIRQGVRIDDVDVRFVAAKPGPTGFRFADQDLFRGFDLIIAIDRGVVEAAEMARRFDTRLGLLSYEIFFPDETPPERKRPEVEACRNLSFAIAPDPIRAQLLSEANEIPIERIRAVPVAGRGFLGPAEKPRVFHEAFGLAPDQKVVLCLGSLADWSGARFLLESTRNWPREWVLVLHERFGPRDETSSMVDEFGNPERIRISAKPFNAPGDMREFVASADLGFAAYLPTFKNEWLGKNIKHIGLSSGKIATYLQHGVPVATHDLGAISDLIAAYRAGVVFSLDDPFIPACSHAEERDGCQRLFEEVLDLDLYAGDIMNTIEIGKELHPGARSRYHGDSVEK